MKKILLIILICLSLIYGISGYYLFSGIPQETVNEPLVYFCPIDNCELQVINFINQAEDYVYCAFFDLGLEGIMEALQNTKNMKLFVDENYFHKVRHLGNVRKDNDKQLMHNKFCVIDDRYIFTGSFNPTYNGNYLNNNNLIFIESSYLAKNFKAEFEEIWEGSWGKGSKVKYPKVILNEKLYENYFCPEDSCEEQVLRELSHAQESIYFMTFAFTSENIANLLISKNKEIKVEGVFETFQNGQYSQYQNLKDHGLNVILDNNPKNMHHKVFIIDEKIVITGSYNPSISGNTRNDENILIIHDENIAKKYVEEFELVKNMEF